MIYTDHPSKIICEAMPLGWLSGMDLTASVELLSEAADIRRSWNGQAKNFSDPQFRLFKIELTSGEGEYRTPPFMRLMPGDIFDIVLDLDFEDFIPTGGTARTLLRDPYPGSIKCKKRDFSDVPFTVSDRTITLNAPASEPILISARYVLTVMITAGWRMSENANTKKITWNLNVEEVGGTL